MYRIDLSQCVAYADILFADIYLPRYVPTYFKYLMVNLWFIELGNRCQIKYEKKWSEVPSMLLKISVIGR